jgi:threonine/homoserine/homoserine lactone efflux protein
MINFTLLSALAAFYFTMFFTPGPNNAMLTASGMKFGFVRTLPHLIGISLGHILQIGLTCFGLANLFLIYPQFYEENIKDLINIPHIFIRSLMFSS